MLFKKRVSTLLIRGITYYKKYQKNGIICFQAPKGFPIFLQRLEQRLYVRISRLHFVVDSLRGLPA